jgi:hypothetical protein
LIGLSPPLREGPRARAAPDLTTGVNLSCMSTSPVSPEDIRAAAEAHHELGPEYSDAVVASFLEKVDRELAARVEARLAEAARTAPRRQHSRRPMLRGAVIGACAGALATTVAFALPALHAGSAGTDRSVPSKVFVPFNNVKGLPQRAILLPAIKPVPAPPAKRPT